MSTQSNRKGAQAGKAPVSAQTSTASAPEARIHRAAPKPRQDDQPRRGVIHRPSSKWAKRGVGGVVNPNGWPTVLRDWSFPAGDSSQPGGWPGVGGVLPPVSCVFEHRVGLGYHPDLPDLRDDVGVKSAGGRSGFGAFREAAKATKNERLADVHTRYTTTAEGREDRGEDGKEPPHFNLGDNSEHPLPPIEDQGQTNSCTAQAAAGLVEYLFRWATGESHDFSRMFIYFNSRKLLGWQRDSGAYIRTTFKAMRLFGVPPEEEWPFQLAILDAEPSPYHYAYADNFKTLNYSRLDGYGTQPTGLYDEVKSAIYAGFPVEFGFPVYDSIQRMGNNFVIPVPAKGDKLLGGHAVLAVGYDDGVQYDDPSKGLVPGVNASPGVLIIRNSWGPDWGDHGYGFLPRWYLDSGCACDFWTAYDHKWLSLK